MIYLSKKVKETRTNMAEQIYFDNGSTSFSKAPGVAEAMFEHLKKGAYNINLVLRQIIRTVMRSSFEQESARLLKCLITSGRMI